MEDREVREVRETVSNRKKDPVPAATDRDNNGTSSGSVADRKSQPKESGDSSSSSGPKPQRQSGPRKGKEEVKTTPPATPGHATPSSKDTNNGPTKRSEEEKVNSSRRK